MIYKYYCKTCVDAEIGPVKLTAAERSEALDLLSVQVEHGINDSPNVPCEHGHGNMQKLLGLANSYVRGFGYLDKRGIKNDMNLSKMVEGDDPYAHCRPAGDGQELIGRLRKNKVFNPRPRRVFMG